LIAHLKPSTTRRESVVVKMPKPPAQPIDMEALAAALAARVDINALADAIVARVDLGAIVRQNADATAAAAAVATSGAIRGASVGVFRVLASMLAVRALLLLGLAGAFALAWVAMQAGTPAAIGIFVAYAVLVMVPLVYLERKPADAKVE